MRKGLIVSLMLVLVTSLILGSIPVSFAQKKYNEAPMLAELVKQGKLPPVEQRLPENPFVVGPGVIVPKKDLPDWKVGKYGGTIRTTQGEPDWCGLGFCGNNEPLLCAPGIGTQGIRGNIVESFDVKENRIFTFKLRKGLKWSDGYPVTTEDIRFAYEDVLLNEKLTPVFPPRFRVGYSLEGESMKLEILDDYTFRIIFPKPYGGLLRNLAIEGWVGYTELLKPAHYLKQFHIKYTSIDKLRPLLEKEGLKDEWWQLFNLKDFTNWEQSHAKSIGFPVLTPWILKKAAGGIYEWERNPYYFKVDTAGNQLPYIDRIVSTQVQDYQMSAMKVIVGEVDFSDRASLVDLPLFKQNEEKGGYRVILYDSHVITPTALFINLTYKDPVWRKIVQDVRFRKAVSMAINRKEVIDSVYYSYASFPESVPSQYNVTEANKLLDQVGLSKRDAEGFRLRPDGKTFTMLIECGAESTDLVPTGELVTEHLKKVGIKASLKVIDANLRGQRQTANELQSWIMWIHDQGSDNDYTSGAIGSAAPEWARWYRTAGKEGEEPPTWAKKAWDLDKKRWESVTGSEEYNKLWREGLAWHKQYIPVISIVENAKYPAAISARMGNVPRSGPMIATTFSVEQFFYEK